MVTGMWYRDDMSDPKKDAKLSPVSAAIAKGKTLGEVLLGYVRPQKQEKPAKIALAVELTDADRAAIIRFMEVYGGVCPQARSTLEPAQLTSLMGERLVLDQVFKLLADRKEGIRTIVLNHMDVQMETASLVDEETPIDKEGHYLVANHVPAPETHQVFAWEISQAMPDVSLAKLYDLCHTEGTGLTHKDWLAMTYEPQVKRVLDDDKATDYLNAHSELVPLIWAAVDVPRAKGSFNIRKEKA